MTSNTFYILYPNDVESIGIEFTKEELELFIIAKELLIKTSNNSQWITPENSDPINIPVVNKKILIKIREWASLVVSLGNPCIIPDKKCIELHSDSLPNLPQLTVTLYPARIDYFTTWTENCMGINQKVLDFISNIPLEDLFDMFDGALFTSCESLTKLIGAYIAYIMIQEQKKVFNEITPNNLNSKVDKFKNWLKNKDTTLAPDSQNIFNKITIAFEKNIWLQTNVMRNLQTCGNISIDLTKLSIPITEKMESDPFAIFRST